MPDPHKVRRSSLRVPEDLKAAALAALQDQPERDDPWTFNDVVVAAAAMLARRPKTFLKLLEPFKPPRKRGRPRKNG